MAIPAPIRNVTLTIANGATDSNSLYIGRGLLLGITFPASFTGATVSFKNSINPVSVLDAAATFSPVYDDAGNLYSVVATDSAYVALDSYYTAGIDRIQVISASPEVGAKSIILHYKEAA